MNWTESLKPGDKIIVSIGNLFPWNYIEKVDRVTDKHIVVGSNKFKKIGCMAEGNTKIRISEATDDMLKKVSEEMTVRKAKDLLSKVTTNMTFESAVKIIKILGEIQNA